MHAFLRLENKNEMSCKITLKTQRNTVAENRLLKAKRLFLIFIFYFFFQLHGFDLAAF